MDVCRGKSMELKPLPKNLRNIVRSGIAIANVAQCVEELVGYFILYDINWIC